MANLPGFQWVDNPRSGGGTYETDGPSCILLHMTVSMGISAGYIASHPYPPQFWANPYTGERWQTISPDRSAFALYQADYGNSWTNKKGYTLQTELVGVPEVNVVTYTDAQCKWIGEQVVAPQAAWLASIGRPVDLTQVRHHTDSSGSASEYWSGRMGDGAEWDSFNGLCAHIDCPQNDHWDCSVERLDLIAAYARGATPEDEMTNDDFVRIQSIVHDQVLSIWRAAEMAALDRQRASQGAFDAGLGIMRSGENAGIIRNQAFEAALSIMRSQENAGVIAKACQQAMAGSAAALRDASVDELLAALKDKMDQPADREETTMQPVANEGNS